MPAFAFFCIIMCHNVKPSQTFQEVLPEIMTSRLNRSHRKHCETHILASLNFRIEVFALLYTLFNE